jgi:DNA-binding beta-propeller fold protein YncE
MHRDRGSLRSALVAGGVLTLLALTSQPGFLAARASSLPSNGGATRWVARLNGPGNGDDWAVSIGVSPDGTRVFVTGQSLGAGTDSDYTTVAYDRSTGAKLWVKRYKGTGNGGEEAVALRVSPDGTRVYVTGTATRSDGIPGYVTIAYGASMGATLWVARYNGSGERGGEAACLAVSADGRKVFVSGRSSGAGTGTDYATVAYDASTGARLWVKRYAPPNSYEMAVALGTAPDGSAVFVTGTSGSDSAADFVTLSYDASTGATRWIKRYNGPGNGMDEAASLAVSPDGTKVFVTGGSRGLSAGGDYATIAYDASSGAAAWVKRYNGPGDYYDAPRSIGVSPDAAEVFVTGDSFGRSGDGDFATIAYDASTGATRWLQRYNGQANRGGEGNSLDVSRDGTKVFVTGDAGSVSIRDYATIVYDSASGAIQWIKRYNGPGNSADIAWSVAVSPDGGTVFVTGASYGRRNTYDFATVAYRTG